jgi:hypothetical protein
MSLSGRPLHTETKDFELAIEKLFILAGMPAAGKSSLGKQHTQPANWPSDDWWEESMMAWQLSHRPLADLPSKLGVEIDFSDIGSDGRPRFGPSRSPLDYPPIKRLVPQFTTIITLWAPAPLLLRRLTERDARHPKEEELKLLYCDPPRFNEFYRAWITCVDSFPHDEHWVFDTSDDQFHRPEWIATTF